MRPLERCFFRRLRQQALAALKDTERILEVGAGTGVNFTLYPSNVHCVASEPSGEMLRYASAKQRGPNVSLVQCVAENLPFLSASFDAALATLVFCSVESLPQSFTELRRVVKSGGLVILLEHVRPTGVLGPIFDLLNLLTVPLFADHFNRRTVDSAVAAGLEVVRVQRAALGIINLIVCRV